MKMCQYFKAKGWFPSVVAEDPKWIYRHLHFKPADYPSDIHVTYTKSLRNLISKGFQDSGVAETEHREHDPRPAIKRFFNPIWGCLSNILKLIRDLFIFPDNENLWIWTAYFASKRYLSHSDTRYFLTSSPPFSCHIVGLLLKRWNPKLFWIADFRDPWIVNPQHIVSKNIIHSIRRAIFNLVLVKADKVTATTGAITQLLYSLSKQEIRNKTMVVPNGVPIHLFDDIVPSQFNPTKTIFCHLGDLDYHHRNPEPILKALGELTASGKISQDDFEIHFFGRSSVWNGKTISSMKADYGIEKAVFDHDPVPHEEALAIMKGTDVLVLFAENQPLQIPAKTYEYLLSGTSIWAFVDKDGESYHLVRQFSSVTIVSKDDIEDLKVKALDLIQSPIRHRKDKHKIEDHQLPSISFDASMDRLFPLIEEIAQGDDNGSTTTSPLSEAVRLHGWRDGMTLSINSRASAERDAFVNALHLCKQTTWMFWLGKGDQDIVLNLDTGLGATTIGLSCLFKEVFGLFADQTGEVCASARAVHEGRYNVRILPGSELKNLPFPKASFDIISISDIETWLDPYRKRGESGRDGGVLVLELSQWLKDDGVFYVGFRRKPLILEWIQKARRSSPRSVELALKSNGFAEIDRLYHYPSLDKIELTQGGEITSWVLRWRRRVKRWVHGESYGLIFARQEVSYSGGAVTEMVKDVVEENQKPFRFRELKAHVGSASTFVLELQNHIVRVPMGATALERCRRNFKALSRLQEKSLLPTPSPCTSGLFGSQPYFVETRLSGREPSISWISTKESHALTEQALAFLVELHYSTAQRIQIGKVDFERLFGAPLQELSSYVDGPDATIFKGAIDRLSKKLIGTKLLLVHTHGDFKRTNLLCTKTNQVVGVVDWDLSQEAGLPFVDLLWYLSYERSLQYRIVELSEAIYRTAFCEDLSENPWVKAYWSQISDNASNLTRICALMCHVYHFHYHAGHFLKSQREWRNKVMVPTLCSALKKALG